MFFSVRDLNVRYNKVVAVKGIDMDLDQGGFIALIGPNGAGKSSTLRSISGLVPPAGGEIHFDGERIDRLSADRILKKGLAHVPENRRIFGDLKVIENLYLGAYLRKDKAAIEQDLQAVFSHFPVLQTRKDQLGRTLSGGEQQMLAMGRALMSRPRLLVLDEPSLGLAPVMVQEIARILLEINRQGVSIILVEQNAELALELSRYGYVLETGTIALSGSSEELRRSDHVRQAYLGA